VEFAGDWALLFGLSFLFVAASLAIGILVSTVSQTQAQAMQLALFILLPSILLSGFIFSRDPMPGIIHAIGWAIPLTYFITIARGIFLKGSDLAVLLPSVLPLAALGVAVVGLAISRFRKVTE
jgi:ABC-2 type transport system permease protein